MRSASLTNSDVTTGLMSAYEWTALTGRTLPVKASESEGASEGETGVRDFQLIRCN